MSSQAQKFGVHSPCFLRLGLQIWWKKYQSFCTHLTLGPVHNLCLQDFGFFFTETNSDLQLNRVYCLDLFSRIAFVEREQKGGRESNSSKIEQRFAESTPAHRTLSFTLFLRDGPKGAATFPFYKWKYIYVSYITWFLVFGHFLQIIYILQGKMGKTEKKSKALNYESNKT